MQACTHRSPLHCQEFTPLFCLSGPSISASAVGPLCFNRLHILKRTSGRVRRTTHTAQSGKNIGQKLAGELLDVALAGPKMRKWYGQKSNLPRDGGVLEAPVEQEPEPQQEESAERDYVLVTDADTPTGELVVLQLILLRAKLCILVKDTAAAKIGYGPYVEPISVDTNSAGELARALKDVRCVVVLGKLGAVLPAAQKAGVQRVVLLSTAGMPQPGGFAALFQNPADAALKEASREATVLSSSIPHVVVKAGIIQDSPGGSSSISITPSNGSSGNDQQCSISREDLASALVASAVHELPALQHGDSAAGLVFEVREAGPGQPPDNWEQLLNGIPNVGRCLS